MPSFTRTMLPAFALVAMMASAQAQTVTTPDQGQDHQAHHPGGATTIQIQPTPAPTAAQPSQGGQPGMMGPGMMGQMMPMMRQMMMGQQGGMGAMGLPFEHVEGRIAFLKAELKITDTQAPQWNAFADTLRSNARAHRAMHEQMTKGGLPPAWPDRLATQQKALATRLDAVKALAAAAKPLYAALTDEQKRVADQLFASPMGMM